MTTRIFNTRLDVATLLRDTNKQDDIAFANEIIERLHLSIVSLDKERFDVKMKLEHVELYEDIKSWQQLSPAKIETIKDKLSKLPVPQSDHPNARRFDLMMLKMMQANLLTKSSKLFENELVVLATDLDKIDIPQVNKSKKLIGQLQDPDFYKTLHIRKMEEIRVEVRELLQYIDSKGIENIYTTISGDEIISSAGDIAVPYGNALYKKNVEKFIRENANHIVISKLNTNQPITEVEIEQLQQILFDGGDRGTYDHYKEIYGAQPLGIFIRSIVGLDIQAAQKEFATFLQSGDLNASQMKFIDQIISHLSRNGTIDKRLLFESPFNEVHDEGLLGVFEDTAAMQIIKKIDSINMNAEVG